MVRRYNDDVNWSDKKHNAWFNWIKGTGAYRTCWFTSCDKFCIRCDIIEIDNET